MKKLTMCAAMVAAVTLGSSTASAQSMEIHGAGATFPAPLYAKWIAAYNASQQTAKLDYQAIGSGGGIKGITDRTVQFGASDGPMTDAQLKAAAAGNGEVKILHIPTVAGPEAMIYNLPGVENLILSGPVIAEIYEAKITKWNDEKIVAINPGVNLPDKDIVVVHRSDGSGTTWIFTNYMSKVSPDWKKTVGNATSVKWPAGVGGKGNDGVAAEVKNAEGGIGYVELAFALDGKFIYASLLNKAGKVVKPTIDGVYEAAKNSPEMPDDFRLSITDAKGDASYPISGFTYLLIYQDLTYLKDKEMASEMLKFVSWCLTKGQEMAAPDYAKLSPEMQTKVQERLKSFVFDGQPLVK